MTKTMRRRIIVLSSFILLGFLHYIIRVSPDSQNFPQIDSIWVIGISLAFALVTLILEGIFYSKRGIFLYALVGLIAGYFSGDVLYKLFCALFQNYCLPEIQPYFMLTFSYLGFFLPINATQKGAYAFQFPAGVPDSDKKAADIKLLDTSVIIDGRISDIAETGFLSGSLVVPKFVLNEIQALADSQDPIKRSRARRGLDVLNKLKEIATIELRISSRDYHELRGVDTKLIQLAKEIHASIFTNDYNLNKIAQLEGIQILNLNDLANAMKPLLLPGEEFEIDVIKEGKENNQGVGYLADGTMVVVASGLNQIGKKLMVRVTSILQTSAGRIIFTEPKDFKDLRK